MQDFNKGIIPEENEAEPVAESGVFFRLRAFFLLLIFLLPILLTLIELLTGVLSETNTPKAVPTPTLFGLGHF